MAPPATRGKGGKRNREGVAMTASKRGKRGRLARELPFFVFLSSPSCSGGFFFFSLDHRLCPDAECPPPLSPFPKQALREAQGIFSLPRSSLASLSLSFSFPSDPKGPAQATRPKVRRGRSRESESSTWSSGVSLRPDPKSRRRGKKTVRPRPSAIASVLRTGRLGFETIC